MHIEEKVCTCLQYVCNYILRCNFHKVGKQNICNTCPFQVLFMQAVHVHTYSMGQKSFQFGSVSFCL